jgi:hypothetical protein
VGRGPRALVADPVDDHDLARAEARRDAPVQDQGFAHGRRLPDRALDLQRVVVAAPALGDAHVLRGGVGNAAVQTEGLTLVDLRLAEMREAAGREQAAAEGAQPAVALGVVLLGGAEGGMEPGQRPAPVLGRAEVEGPVDEHLEAEAAARPDVGGAQAARLAVRDLDQPDAGDLGEAAREAAQVRGAVVAAEETRHRGWGQAYPIEPPGFQCVPREAYG